MNDGDDMQSAKQEVQEMLVNLPDDSTFEDIQYHLYVLEKVRRGADRLESEGGISQEDAERRMSRWITK
ncbi:MAG: hypothetical protein OIF38_10765 [Cellvibrionaceae bacterium]|nr:hypothetical protein [Cellvibrionaceae bacterium]